MAAASSLIPFDTNPNARQVAEDNSLLQIDQELDTLLEQIEDEIEERGDASKELMDRLQVFAEAMNIKVDRIGRYLSVMETRATHCKKEAARLATRCLTEFRACAPQIMGCQFCHSDPTCCFLDDVPDRLGRHPLCQRLSLFADPAKDLATLDASGGQPVVEFPSDPIGNGNGSDVTGLAHHIDDGPASMNFDFRQTNGCHRFFCFRMYHRALVSYYSVMEELATTRPELVNQPSSMGTLYGLPS